MALSKNKVSTFTEYVDSSDVNYTIFTQYKTTYKETDISFSPNVIAAGNLLIYPIKNLEIAFLNKYVGQQYLTNTSDNQRAINDYFFTDVRVNYTIHTSLIKELTIMAMVYNATNTSYVTNGYNYSFYSDDKLYKQNSVSPAAPTHFMLGLNMKF